jgi:hypothetical protein
MKMTGRERMKLYIDNIGDKKMMNYLKASSDRDQMVIGFRDWVTENKIDAIISPGFPFPSNPHGLSIDTNGGSCYCFIHNVLECPAGVIPNVHTITKEEADGEFECLYHKKKDFFQKAVQKVLKGSEGMTTGINVAVLPSEDEELLAAMECIKECLDKHYPEEKMELEN